jgi:hypothetical protein
MGAVAPREGAGSEGDASEAMKDCEHEYDSLHVYHASKCIHCGEVRGGRYTMESQNVRLAKRRLPAVKTVDDLRRAVRK